MNIIDTLTTRTPLRALIATAVLGSLAASLTTVSAAADSTDAPTVVVQYGDLNVSSPQGAAALYHRIAAAASEVCDSFLLDSRNLISLVRLTACIHKAIADAVTKVGEPELVAIYNAKNRGEPLPVSVAQTR